jgi:septum formation protein
VVLAADTVVAVGRRLLEKAADEAEATKFLTLLSGRNHRVFTGVAVAHGDTVISRVVDTRVTFKVLSPAEIAGYVAGGDWRGKAGRIRHPGTCRGLRDKIAGSLSGGHGSAAVRDGQSAGRRRLAEIAG